MENKYGPQLTPVDYTRLRLAWSFFLLWHQHSAGTGSLARAIDIDSGKAAAKLR